MATPHKRFYQQSWTGAQGTDVAAIPPTSADTASPYFGAEGGTAQADGTGGLLIAAGAFARSLVSTPAGGEYDVIMGVKARGSTTGSGVYIEQDAVFPGGAGGAYSLDLRGGPNVVFQKYGGGGGLTTLTLTNFQGGAAIPAASVLIKASKRLPGDGTAVWSFSAAPATVDGDGKLIASAAYAPIVSSGGSSTATDTNPNTGSVASTASPFSNSGSTTFGTIEYDLPAATAATFAGPASPSVGTASSYTATLNQPAGPEGVVVVLSSTGSGDTTVAATIADGQTTGTPTLTPSTNGARTLAPSASGITFTPSTLAVTAAGGSTPTPTPTPTPTNATGYTLAASPASSVVGTAVAVTATLTGGTALPSNSPLVIALADSLGSTGTKSITIANGATTGATTLTATAAGTHAITATHTGGGFTGGDGSTSFAATTPTPTPTPTPSDPGRNKKISIALGPWNSGLILTPTVYANGAVYSKGAPAVENPDGPGEYEATVLIPNLIDSRAQWPNYGNDGAGNPLYIGPTVDFDALSSGPGSILGQLQAFFEARDDEEIDDDVFDNLVAKTKGGYATANAAAVADVLPDATIKSVSDIPAFAIGQGAVVSVQSPATSSFTLSGPGLLAPSGGYASTVDPSFLKFEVGAANATVRRRILTHAKVGNNHVVTTNAFPVAVAVGDVASIN